MAWQQGGYPNQGPPPPGFQVPYPQHPYPPGGQPGYPPPPGGIPQGGYPQGGYPGGYQPGAPPSYDTVYGGPPPQDPGMYGGTTYASEPAGEVGGYEFSDKQVRAGFIRKVYSILMCQLLVTAGIIALCLFHEPTRLYIQRNSWIWGIAFALSIVVLFALSCCGNLRRKFPTNFILLGTFTLAEGVILGFISGNYQVQEVFLAVAITAIICFGLTVFAFQTKWDFTVMGAGLFVAVLCLMVFGIIALIFKTKILTLVYSCLGALLFSLYLVYDTQVMLGGKHKYAISPEEYIFAALSLYMDIINIFLYILTIIGVSRD